MTRIFIVIVTYNGAPWIEACLGSILQSSVPSEVIVVDNNSKDHTIKIVGEKFPDVHVVENCQNLGFGKANNIGISEALAAGADYIFLLNQDVRVEDETISNLLNASKNNPSYGVLSPIHLNWTGDQLEYYFLKFILKNPRFYSDYVLNKELSPVYDVPFVNAAAWFIPRATFELVGGFDPAFFHYGEDNNYCQRLKYHGQKIGVVPDAFIMHNSAIRKVPDNYLFSEKYYQDERTSWLISFCDINKKDISGEVRKEQRKIRNLILLKLITGQFSEAKGYIKKMKVFTSILDDITISRNMNIHKASHYIH